MAVKVKTTQIQADIGQVQVAEVDLLQLNRLLLKLVWIIAYPFPPLVEMHKLLIKLRFMEIMARVRGVVMADRVAEKPGLAAEVKAVLVV